MSFFGWNICQFLLLVMPIQCVHILLTSVTNLWQSVQSGLATYVTTLSFLITVYVSTFLKTLITSLCHFMYHCRLYHCVSMLFWLKLLFCIIPCTQFLLAHFKKINSFQLMLRKILKLRHLGRGYDDLLDSQERPLPRFPRPLPNNSIKKKKVFQQTAPNRQPRAVVLNLGSMNHKGVH